MSDDKIECPNCNKMITPHIVFRSGDAEKAICKLCGETIWTNEDGGLFGLVSDGIEFIVGILQHPKK